MAVSDDRFEISQQIFRYAHAWDSNDVETFLDVFIENLVGDGVMYGETELFSHIEGRDAMRTFFEGGHGADASPVLHHTSGILFDELDETSAKTRSTVVVTRQTDDGPVIATHGVYHDTWTKTEDGWKIARRLYQAYGYRTQPQLAGQAGRS
jgi:ketosteroid isomerase-like protein